MTTATAKMTLKNTKMLVKKGNEHVFVVVWKSNRILLFFMKDDLPQLFHELLLEMRWFRLYCIIWGKDR